MGDGRDFFKTFCGWLATWIVHMISPLFIIGALVAVLWEIGTLNLFPLINRFKVYILGWWDFMGRPTNFPD